MSKNKNKTPWYVGGMHFECAQCGRCCSGPAEGYIWVTNTEIKLIAEFLKISTESLRKNFLKRIGLRNTIIEKPITKDCIFLQKSSNNTRCTIYPVRPTQCRTWPFWPDNLTDPEAWNRAAQKCLGINRGRLHSFKEIEKTRKTKKWWLQSEKTPN
ncbi:MAG: YkgJ family cysteine cluster protein [Sedimentisphaerales bacterium]|nr:YkgJ family cysteine cluster protein [Sedimentisphaerales bacterium]